VTISKTNVLNKSRKLILGRIFSELIPERKVGEIFPGLEYTMDFVPFRPGWGNDSLEKRVRVDSSGKSVEKN
jgi:hypothetical protein